MAAALRAPIPFPLPQDLTGRKIGRFEVRQKLGAGGMGEVYCAQDTELQRPVALKRVPRRLGNDPQARQKILREARRASVLNSEHIATVHDVIEEQGELFLVMEYVEGETLRRYLRQPVSLEQFFDIATQSVAALMEAHEHGIVHCDIKPENIMLTPKGHIKVLDFGLAKHLPRSDRSSTLESFEGLVGTAGYMSPEVLLERLPDPRTDIFSLGVVFYEMLTLRNPFNKGSFIATSECTLHTMPIPVHCLNANVSEALEAIVMKAIAKNPGQRYASAAELLEDLCQVRDGGSPAKIATALRGRQLRTRRQWLIPAVLILVVLVLSFAIYNRMHRAPVLAERGWILISDFESSGEDAIPEQAVREGLTIVLQQSRYINIFPGTRVYEGLRRMKKGNITRLDEAVGCELCQRENIPVLLAGRIEHIGEEFQITVRALSSSQCSLMFAEQQRFTRKEDFFKEVDALGKKIRQDLGESLEGIEKRSRPLALVTTSSLDALQLYSQAREVGDQGKNEQVPILLKGAIALDPDFAMAHLRLGQYYSAGVGKNEAVITELQRAYELKSGVTEREQYRIEAGYFALQERYEEEVQALSVLTGRYPDDEEAHRELASAYRDVGRFDKAITELREVLRLNPRSLPAYQSLILYLAHSNQEEAAISTFHEAQKREIESPRMHWGLGLAYLALGQANRAREEFQKIGRATQADRELQDINLVGADLYEGKFDAARSKLIKQIDANSLGRGNLQTIRHYWLGRIYLELGNLHQAIAEAHLIHKTSTAELQTYDLLNAGILYARAGEMKQAQDVLRQLDGARRSVPSSWNLSCFYNLEGEIWIAAGKALEAQRFFTSALQEYPQAVADAGLAKAYQMQKHWDLAAHKWEQVVTGRGELLQDGFPPDFADAHLQLARVYREMHQPGLARRHYEDVVRMWQHGDQVPSLDEAKPQIKKLTTESFS